MKKKLFYILFLLLITPLCFELALRISGHTAYQNQPYSITSSPKNCLIGSDSLGFALDNGTFDVNINNKHTYTATHANGRRITALVQMGDSLPSIFMMGCSFTYGMGVSDTENFPYLIQQKLDNFRIHNMGVPGYGTVQSYLQLKNAINAGIPPEIVVINYCDFHDERNVLTPAYRQHLMIGFARSSDEAALAMRNIQFPSFKKGTVIYEKGDEIYSNWWGRETFAAVNYLQSNDDKTRSSALDPAGETLHLFKKIQALCSSTGIRLVVTSLDNTAAGNKFLKRLSSEGITTLDISLDLSTKKYSNRPYDSHPNRRAHKHYAALILKFLQGELVQDHVN